MNPSCRSKSESGYASGMGSGGASGVILYTNSGSGEGGARPVDGGIVT